jgi:hypothetical protein
MLFDPEGVEYIRGGMESHPFCRMKKPKNPVRVKYLIPDESLVVMHLKVIEQPPIFILK